MKYALLLFTASVACNSPYRFAGWVIDQDSIKTGEAMIDSKKVPWGKAVAWANMICPDSVIAAQAKARADSLKADTTGAAKKP